VRRVLKVREGGLEGEGVLGAEEHEGHGGAEQDDAGLGVFVEFFALEEFLPEGDRVVGEPVVADAVDVFAGEADVVVGEVGVVWGELGEKAVLDGIFGGGDCSA